MKDEYGHYVFYDKLVIHDQEVKNSVFYTVKIKLESVFNELKDIEEWGYTYRAGKRVEGKELNKLVKKLNVELDLLEKLMIEADKYRIKSDD